MIAASVVSRKTMKKIGIEKYSSAPMVRTRIDRCAKKKKRRSEEREKGDLLRGVNQEHTLFHPGKKKNKIKKHTWHKWLVPTMLPDPHLY